MTPEQPVPPINDTPLSPLVTPNKLKTMGGRIAIALVAMVLIYAIFKGDNAAKKEAQAEQPIENGTASGQSTPQLTLSPKQQQQLVQNMAQLDQGIGANQAMSDAQKLQQLREAANSLVYHDDNQATTATSALKSQNTLAAPDGNSQFLTAAGSSAVPTVKARQLQHLNTLLAQGNIITATLESRIASDLPGMVRAVTAMDVYSEDNTQVLLPKGSRLIGQYNSGIAQGQNRVFVIWQRVLRPDGIDVQLGSPGTDALGTAGLGADNVDHHFMQQFGAAALLSVIGAGAANVGVNSNDSQNSASAYRSALANSFSQTAQSTLQQGGVIKPTLYINQGQTVTVFVAKDLDFNDVGQGEL